MRDWPFVALLRLMMIVLKKHCLIPLLCRQQARPKLNPLGLGKWYFTYLTCCVLLFSCRLSSHWYSSERHSRANVTQRTYMLRCQWTSEVPPEVNVCNITFVVLPKHSQTGNILLALRGSCPNKTQSGMCYCVRVGMVSLTMQNSRCCSKEMTIKSWKSLSLNYVASASSPHEEESVLVGY